MNQERRLILSGKEVFGNSMLMLDSIVSACCLQCGEEAGNIELIAVSEDGHPFFLLQSVMRCECGYYGPPVIKDPRPLGMTTRERQIAENIG